MGIMTPSGENRIHFEQQVSETVDLLQQTVEKCHDGNMSAALSNGITRWFDNEGLVGYRFNQMMDHKTKDAQ